MDLIRREPGSGDPEPKFGETFGFALFRQGSVLFARFCPFLPGFDRSCPFFPVFAYKCLFFFARFCPVCQVCLVLPKFVRILSFSFVVRMRSSLPPGQNNHWRKPNFYCKAIELVCCGSSKICVLVEGKALNRVKSE